MPRHRRLNLAPEFGVGRIRFDGAQHVGERIDELLGQCAVSRANELELLLRLDVESCDPLQEYLGEIVTRLDLSTLDQAQQQRVSLGRGDVLELGGVEHLRFGGKVSDFGRRQTSQELALVAEHFEPAQVADEFVQVRQRRPRRRLFERIEHAALGRLGME